MILAIDPGNIESAYVALDDNLKPLYKGKIENLKMIEVVRGAAFYKDCHIVIEMVACYGMAVGKEVFETCVWIGRFTQEANTYGMEVTYIYRKDEKMNLCNTMKAKDSNIIQALKDRFGDKGTKTKPGWFHGFKADIWQSYAVGVTYHDMYLRGDKVDK